MDSNFHEVYSDVEKAIDYAFEGKFVLKFYDYLKIRKTKRNEINQFIESSTATEISNLVIDLEEYGLLRAVAINNLDMSEESLKDLISKL